MQKAMESTRSMLESLKRDENVFESYEVDKSLYILQYSMFIYRFVCRSVTDVLQLK